MITSGNGIAVSKGNILSFSMPVTGKEKSIYAP
jgi:hypothetical protein